MGSSSFGHAVRRLDPDLVDEHDRWGRNCTTGRGCQEPITHVASYAYVTGRAGRVSSAERLACDVHARRFAARYGIEVGDPAPPRLESASRAHAEAMERTATLRRSPGRLTAEWSLSMATSGAGAYLSWHVLDVSVPDGGGLEEAITTAEQFLVRSMLVPNGGWQRAGERATASLMPVAETPAWRGVSWTCTVLCGPDASGEPTWYLERQLSAEFDAQRYPLGNTGMDLDRAVRTAQRCLERDGWTVVGTWSRSGQVAVVHAHPPARGAVTRPAPVAAASPGRGLARPPVSRQPAPISAMVS